MLFHCWSFGESRRVWSPVSYTHPVAAFPIVRNHSNHIMAATSADQESMAKSASSAGWSKTTTSGFWSPSRSIKKRRPGRGPSPRPPLWVRAGLSPYASLPVGSDSWSGIAFPGTPVSFLIDTKTVLIWSTRLLIAPTF